VLDENVKNAEDVKKLGIDTGDMIALEPRFRMENGYVKSRFVDDKACAAVLFTYIRAMRSSGISPARKTYAYFAFYEEIGHGTVWLPEGVKDILAIDIAPTGPDQNSDERKVSVFAKDSRYPYHVGMMNELRDAAERAGADYVTDIFTPHYGTDGDASVAAGYDIRHGAIGPGTLNSHGYERTHIDGLRNTFLLLSEYLGEA
jgi:putative aminopeptidase FrvX